MAGIANAQAGVVAANVRALITGTGELTSYETLPPMIAIPLGPEGGAGLLGDGIADAATIADLKGRHNGHRPLRGALRHRPASGRLRPSSWPVESQADELVVSTQPPSATRNPWLLF
jgi:hypothetical protein